MALTRRQREVYDFIRKFVKGKGYSPTLEEIGAHFGLSSASTVHRHVQHLIRKGFLKKSWNSGRSIEPVAQFSAYKQGELTEAREEIRELKEIAMRDASQDGQRYRKMRRVTLDIIKALGDPETPVCAFDHFVERDDFYDVMWSYIEPLIAAKEEGSKLAQANQCISELQKTNRRIAPTNGSQVRLRPSAVIHVVASRFNTTPEALASRSRKSEILLPRQFAMYLCRRHTDASLAEIGRALKREHPSVRNAVLKIERGLQERASVRDELSELVKLLDDAEAAQGVPKSPRATGSCVA